MSQLPLILLPGLLSDQTIFRYQVNTLKKVTKVQVITLNDVNSPELMTNKILQLAPERFMLAGHSLGGWVALRIMKIAPHRVSKLCLMNTSIEKLEAKEITERQSTLTRIEKGEFYEIACELVDKFIFNVNVRQRVLNMFLQAGKQSLINQTQAMIQRENLHEVLPTICCPTWVIHSEQDKRFSFETVNEISNLIPRSMFKIIHRCGHMSPIECPETVTEILKKWIECVVPPICTGSDRSLNND